MINKVCHKLIYHSMFINHKSDHGMILNRRHQILLFGNAVIYG